MCTSLSYYVAVNICINCSFFYISFTYRRLSTNTQNVERYITRLFARVNANHVHKDVLNVRSYTGLLGNELNGSYVPIESKFIVVPSSDISLISILQAPHVREFGYASLGLVDIQRDPRRRNLIFE